MKRHILLELLLTFAKIGLFTFGGGYAMLSLIETSCVEKKRWITHDDMMRVTVIAESTPGPIAINCATFVGYRQAGLAGALAATFGVVFPSFAVIFAVSKLLDHFLEIAVIASAFRGIKTAVGVLILDAALTMVQKMRRNAFSVAVLLCSCTAMLCIDLFALNISSISLMLLAAAAGLGAFFLHSMLGPKGGAGQ